MKTLRKYDYNLDMHEMWSLLRGSPWLSHLKMHRLGGACGALKDHILAKHDQ